MGLEGASRQAEDADEGEHADLQANTQSERPRTLYQPNVINKYGTGNPTARALERNQVNMICDRFTSVAGKELWLVRGNLRTGENDRNASERTRGTLRSMTQIRGPHPVESCGMSRTERL